MNEPEDYEWLEFFYAESDFGPADSDVREILYQQYLEGGGKPVDYMEGNSEY